MKPLKPKIDRTYYPKGKEARFTYDLGRIAFDKKEPPRFKKEEKESFNK